MKRDRGSRRQSGLSSTVLTRGKPTRWKNQSPRSGTRFHDNPVNQRLRAKRCASLPAHLLPDSACASSTVPKGRSRVPRRSAPHPVSRRLFSALRSSRSSAGHRFPPILPRLSAQSRPSLSQSPPRGVTSGLSASGPPLARVLVSVPGAGGSGGAVRGPCSGGVRFPGG